MLIIVNFDNTECQHAKAPKQVKGKILALAAELTIALSDQPSNTAVHFFKFSE
jgi:hypothetical protein